MHSCLTDGPSIIIFVFALSIVLRLVLVGPPILIHHKQHPLFDYRPQRVIYLCHCISIHNAEYSIYSATLTHFESVQVLRVTDADWEKKPSVPYGHTISILMMIGITVTSMGLTFDGLARVKSNIPVYKKRYIMLTKVRQVELALWMNGSLSLVGSASSLC